MTATKKQKAIASNKADAKHKEPNKQVNGQTVIQVFNPSASPTHNIQQFVKSAKAILPALFEGNVSWDDHTWNIAGFEPTLDLKNTGHDANILFTSMNGRKPRQKVAKKDEIPFQSPYIDTVKAVVAHNHNNHKITHSAHMVAMRGWRYLYDALGNSDNPCVSQLLPVHFKQAIAEATDREKESTLYVTGVQLESIATLVDERGLTKVPLNWRNPIPRSYKHGGALHNRGGGKAKQDRAEKLPKKVVLLYLAALWNHYDELEEKDRALTCMAIILLLCGFRMDEFVGLDYNCIPTREEYNQSQWELDPQTGTLTKVLRMRAMTRKSYVWESKPVPICAVDTIFLAVERLRALCINQRRTAQMFIEEGRWNRLANYDDDDCLSTRELMSIVGLPISQKSSNATASLKEYGLKPDPRWTKRPQKFRVGDIHKCFTDRYKKMIGPLVDGFGSDGFAIPLWELLTLRYENQYNYNEMWNAFPKPLSGTQIQDFFRGRDYNTRLQKSGKGGDSKRRQSVFERYNFAEVEDEVETAHTHQFRHLLNTLMQESDSFSQEDIAKYFLRKGTKDNSAYNHQIEPKRYAERTRELQDKIKLSMDIDLDSAKETIKRFPLLSHEELERDLDESGSYHFMDIGRCRHDYSQGPCGMHYACLRNCRNYKRTKGDQKEVDKITARRDKTVAQIELAKNDVDDGFIGANNWLLNHQELVDGCDAALAIEDDSRYQDGDVVQVFPNGIDLCEEADDD